MYVGLGQSECATHADCPGADMYCQGGNCVYQPPEQMAECTADAECDVAGGYICVGGRCGKAAPPPAGPPPSGPPPKTPATIIPAKAGINFDVVVLAAIVVGAGAYLYGRQR